MDAMSQHNLGSLAFSTSGGIPLLGPTLRVQVHLSRIAFSIVHREDQLLMSSVVAKVSSSTDR